MEIQMEVLRLIMEKKFLGFNYIQQLLQIQKEALRHILLQQHYQQLGKLMVLIKIFQQSQLQEMVKVLYLTLLFLQLHLQVILLPFILKKEEKVT